MRIDNDVDDRLDPFRSTEAAAQLLSYNYRLLGTWPLALTAYNHGAAGMRRAKDQLGTDDIVQIVRHYKSPTFGFASRNFYVSFLAALEIDRNPDKYFGSLHHLPEAKYQEVSLPAFVRVNSLERALKIDRSKLRQLNPALMRAVWEGRRYVPRGYKLRLPGEGEQWTQVRLAKVLAPEEQLASQPQPKRYRIARGDTLVLVAQRFNLAPHDLAAANGLRDNAKLRPGRTLELPEAAATRPAVVASNIEPPKTALAAATVPVPPAGGVPQAVAEQESKEEAAAVAAVAKPSQTAQPVSAAQAEELSPAIGPAAENTASADPFDYSVSKQDTITVAGGETLGHYADWLGETAARLRAINHMKFSTPVIVGRHVKLEFAQTSREKFEETRREYHRALQASYFAAHRISGTEVYVVKSGDSMWTVMRRYGGLPLWLVQQYNPDADLTSMRPGTQIVVPRVEEVAASEPEA
jgi:membrane-bound lytic murein transglycosylase D